MANYGSVDAVRRRLRSFFALGTAGLWGGDATVAQDARIVGYLEDASQEITARLAGRLRITDPDACGITLCAVLIACYQIIMDEFTGKAPVPGDAAAVNSWREQAERILADLMALSAADVAAADGIELVRSREVFPISIATEPRVEWP
jgi:hypothetical protein